MSGNFPAPGGSLDSWAVAGALLAQLTICCSPLTGQVPAALDQERRDFAHWLATAPLSPYAILVLQPVGAGISIGYEPADIPLPIKTRGMARETGGAVILEQGDRRITLPRGRAVPLEGFQLIVSGPPGRAAIAAYGPIRHYSAPEYYPYRPGLALTVTLTPPEHRGEFRTLAPDGSESEATELGMVDVAIDSAVVRLRVYRIGAATDEEADFLVFFRDLTSGHGSYPAGRFVPLLPAGAGRYLLDFNRARNPFCAYSSVLPCPAPWPGNSIPARIEAGERYHSRETKS